MNKRKFINFICVVLIIVNTTCLNVYAEALEEPQNNSNTCKQKIAFLTFDDGPCVNNTQKIVNILNENNIKASFFIVGQKAEENPKAMKALVDSGMCLMPHTYSHDYKIYKSSNDYFNDLNKCMETIKKFTGSRKKFNYVRIPGGSDNLVSNRNVLSNIRKDIIKNDMYYVDWNVCSGDAEAHYVPKVKIVNNVKKQSSDKNMIVILMHDAYYKKTTVESLPEIIKYIKDQGYTFKTFDDINESEKKELIRIRVIDKKQKND